MVSSALRFVLAQDVSTVLPGLRSTEEVEVAAKVGEEYRALTKDEKKHFRVRLGRSCCRDCGLCLPCPENIDIAAVLRFHTLATTYGLVNWAKKLYVELEVKAENCTRCGECEPKCPHKLPIISALQAAQKGLST
jgi:predicted aldo/keto reductase-like oxidoreductase